MYLFLSLKIKKQSQLSNLGGFQQRFGKNPAKQGDLILQFLFFNKNVTWQRQSITNISNFVLLPLFEVAWRTLHNSHNVDFLVVNYYNPNFHRHCFQNNSDSVNSPALESEAAIFTFSHYAPCSLNCSHAAEIVYWLSLVDCFLAAEIPLFCSEAGNHAPPPLTSCWLIALCARPCLQTSVYTEACTTVLYNGEKGEKNDNFKQNACFQGTS